jgi:ferric-chelate reductase
VTAAVVFYAIDHVARVVKTRITTARLRPLPELGITRVEVPSLNAGWRAGQHVRIRVLSSSMGWWGWSEVHPFTIANTTHTPEGVVLMCKKTGRWTNNLFNMAQTSSYGESGKEAGRDVTVVVEGPYGTLSCRRGAYASDRTFFVLSKVAWDIP